MTLTQRITTVIQQRKIMQRHIELQKQEQQTQEQLEQYSEPQRLSRQGTSSERVTIWSNGKRI